VNGKLVILAGGISSRMKLPDASDGLIDEKLLDDADSKSKTMIRIGDNDRPFLDYLLFNVCKVGYKEIVIVVGEKDSSIKDYYNKLRSENDFKVLEITYAVQPIPGGREKPLGTADALLWGLKSKPEWKGSTFIVCNSDNLYSQRALKLLLNSPYQNAMIDYDRRGLEFEKKRIEKFAVTIKDKEGFLIDIIEKPSNEEIQKVEDADGFIGVSMNIFRLNFDIIFSFLENVPIHPVRKEKELPSAIKMMIDRFPKSLFTYRLNEHVPDLTSKNDILKVKKYIEEEFPNFSAK